MLRFFPRLYSQGVGLDIQKHEIRLVQIRKKQERIFLEKTQVITLPADTIVDGKIRRFDEMQMALLTLTQQITVKKCNTTIGLPANYVISKRLQLPLHLTPLELEMELTNHLSHYFPGMKETLFYDYVKLSSEDSRYDSVFVVAARSDQITNYVNVVQSIGLKVKIVDIDIYAFIRAIRIIGNIQSPSFILLEVHSIGARLIVIHEEELVFYQSFTRETSDQLYDQLKQAWHLYRATYTEWNVSSIFLLGGQPELLPWIEQEFLVTACVIHFLQEFSQLSYELLAAFGLALRALKQ